MQKLFCDGGVIGRNPSKIGGMTAWCLVEGITLVSWGGGVVTPRQLGVKEITNNITEFLAAVEALRAMEDGWRGVLYTDSEVTLRRIRKGRAGPELPPELLRKLLEEKERLLFTVELVCGHPTKKELAKGFRERNGLPTSEWNLWCDKKCVQLANEYRQKHRIKLKRGVTINKERQDG